MTDPVRSSSARPSVLPDHPSLEHLRKEAKSRLKVLRATDPTARLAAAQRDVARDYGFPSWRRLQADVSKLSTARETEDEKIQRLKIDQARPRKGTSIDPYILDRYLGYYELNPKTIITVRRDEDDLIARLTGQMFLSLVPESDRKLFYRNSNIHAQLSFTVEPSGRAVAVTLHQHGLEQTATRVDEDRAKSVEKLREDRQASNMPLPGSERALRRHIDQMRNGSPDYSLMSKRLTAAVKEQLRDSMRELRNWGEPISIKFIGVSAANDWDVYEVQFSAARAEWHLSMEGPDKIEGLWFRQIP